MPGTIDFQDNTFQNNYCRLKDELYLLGLYKSTFENAHSQIDSFTKRKELDREKFLFYYELANVCFEEMEEKINYLSNFEYYFLGILKNRIDCEEEHTLITRDNWEELLYEFWEYLTFYNEELDKREKLHNLVEEADKELDEFDAKFKAEDPEGFKRYEEEIERQVEEDLKKTYEQEFLRNLDTLTETFEEINNRLQGLNKYFKRF